jgi:hypothetical protein
VILTLSFSCIKGDYQLHEAKDEKLNLIGVADTHDHDQR